MAKVKKPRNRAAQDATLINIRTLKKRVVELECAVRAILLSTRADRLRIGRGKRKP